MTHLRYTVVRTVVIDVQYICVCCSVTVGVFMFNFCFEALLFSRLYSFLKLGEIAEPDSNLESKERG